jgi:hypothetical protein
VDDLELVEFEPFRPFPLELGLLEPGVLVGVLALVVEVVEVVVYVYV